MIALEMNTASEFNIKGAGLKGQFDRHVKRCSTVVYEIETRSMV